MVFHARSERLTPRVAVYSLRVRHCKVCEPFGWIGRRWHLLAMLSQIFSLVCPSNPDPLVTELQTSTSVESPTDPKEKQTLDDSVNSTVSTNDRSERCVVRTAQESKLLILFFTNFSITSELRLNLEEPTTYLLKFAYRDNMPQIMVIVVLRFPIYIELISAASECRSYHRE